MNGDDTAELNYQADSNAALTLIDTFGKKGARAIIVFCPTTLRIAAHSPSLRAQAKPIWLVVGHAHARVFTAAHGMQSRALLFMSYYNNKGTRDKWTICGVRGASVDNTVLRKATVTRGEPDWAKSAGRNCGDCQW